MSTGSGLFAVSLRMKTRGNTNLVVSRLINGEKGSFPVEVRRSRALLKLPFYPTEDIFYPPETVKALLLAFRV